MNRVVLVGRLTKDLELKKTGNNTSAARFTIACNRRKKEDGADFINCIAWNQSADFLCNYARKGDLVGVDGRITTGSYDGTNGKVYTTEVTCESVSLLLKNKAKGNGSVNVDISPDQLPFY